MYFITVALGKQVDSTSAPPCGYRWENFFLLQSVLKRVTAKKKRSSLKYSETTDKLYKINCLIFLKKTTTTEHN